ncbi:MAG: 2Fe-2S iron-sulfur cluster binding domain-containing protein [Oscillatoriophycideae cyanobacterium NC_groundwater_1537_Pr4_S-0.65um_50_18]|nr:2Fe-2S iron-sulfur cluster binding domain-containing protein [Oscillatoriophycideae cyanobacterium NC_groundwater_1537_Pr4_S-0.65um_50_18]
MAVYQVRLVNEALGLDRTIAVPDDQYIIDIAEESGIRLPAGCKQGECSACIAKLVAGEVDQTEQKFLRPQELSQGYAVTCVAYPRSNCTLLTHQEQMLYQSSLYYTKKDGTQKDGTQESTPKEI